MISCRTKWFWIFLNSRSHFSHSIKFQQMVCLSSLSMIIIDFPSKFNKINVSFRLLLSLFWEMWHCLLLSGIVFKKIGNHTKNVNQLEETFSYFVDVKIVTNDSLAKYIQQIFKFHSFQVENVFQIRRFEKIMSSNWMWMFFHLRNTQI